jgi:hypothetical protein
MLRMRTLPAGFIAPCLPTKTDTLPSGGLWLQERRPGEALVPPTLLAFADEVIE